MWLNDVQLALWPCSIWGSLYSAICPYVSLCPQKTRHCDKHLLKHLSWHEGHLPRLQLEGGETRAKSLSTWLNIGNRHWMLATFKLFSPSFKMCPIPCFCIFSWDKCLLATIATIDAGGEVPRGPDKQQMPKIFIQVHVPQAAMLSIRKENVSYNGQAEMFITEKSTEKKKVKVLNIYIHTVCNST